MLQRKLSGRRHQARIDDAEHALARKHETGAGEPRDVGRSRDHKRQPECNATMPPERVCQLTREKPAERIISANAFGRGNLRIEFDEVPIGFGVAGDGAAERRNHLEREQIVEPVEPGHVDGGKFQAQKPAAGPQHPKGFAQGKIDPRHVADAERDGVGIEGAVGKGELLGVALDERDAIVEMPRRCALAADREHVRN